MTRLLVGDGLYFGQQLVELEDSNAKIHWWPSERGTAPALH